VPWAKLDDKFHSHPKTYVAGLDGCGLFAKAISYAADHLTDGFVPEAWVLAQVPATRKQKDRRGVVERLIEAGMFERVAGGYLIHGYLEMNPSRADVEGERAEAAERMREVRAKRKKRSPERGANVSGSSATPYPYPTHSSEPDGSEQREHEDFASWVAHHEQTTGQRQPRSGTKVRKDIAAMYGARRAEGYSAEDLCLATVGAFNDSYRREHGHYGCESVLRPTKVHDLAEKGRRGAPTDAAQGRHTDGHVTCTGCSQRFDPASQEHRMIGGRCDGCKAELRAEQERRAAA